MLVGRIILARFLERSPGAFERLVERTDQEASMVNAGHAAGADPPVRLATLAGASWEGTSAVPTRALARVDDVPGGPAALGPRLVYRSRAFVREYDVDDNAFDTALARQDEPGRIQLLRLLSRMRLANSRNRLTHAVLSALAERQAAFLRTADPVQLQPLSQKALVQRLEAPKDGRGPAADASRVSRVLAGGSLLLPDGNEVELARLCPSPRRVHRELVRDLVRREQARMVAGEIEAPLADHLIADEVSARCTVPASRRAVAFIRKALGVPNARARARRGCYLTVTAGFSCLRPARARPFRQEAPRAPGVYEVRIEPPGVDYPAGRFPVVYIGSSQNLRKRLLEHVRGNGRNERLMEKIATGHAQVRWMLVPDQWRCVERRIYRQFVETFGAPPVCNRMSP